MLLEHKDPLGAKYQQSPQTLFVSGTQALVRLMLARRWRDQRNGLNTAGFISGYRGSPLGAVDLELSRQGKLLQENEIVFQPGLNEDLAATSIWGTQQIGLYDDANRDGVFSLWYGKGPGADRSGDVFRHANLAGTAPNGGVLAIAGDDHGAKSSTTAHQSEFTFQNVQIPVFNPATLEDVLIYGMTAFELSRFSGCWTGMVAISDTIETSTNLINRLDQLQFDPMKDYALPMGGLHIRGNHSPLDQEYLLNEYRLPAVIEFIERHRLNKVVWPEHKSNKNKLGIITTGKSYLDVRQTLDDLGLNEALAKELGICVFKIAVTWPVAPDSLKQFASDVEELLIVEEKRPFLEPQIRAILYDLPEAKRPKIFDRHHQETAQYLPIFAEFSPAKLAFAIANRLKALFPQHEILTKIDQYLAFLSQKDQQHSILPELSKRLPYFCPGCPHNRSTKVPEGSKAGAGIGCHYMAIWMNRDTALSTQMGGEGASFIGQSPFCEREHMFVNLGDGTYAHSGSLAVRACVNAGVNITFKLLYNGVVAMTGGQALEEQQSVANIAWQLHAEGVTAIIVTSDDIDQHRKNRSQFPAICEFFDRKALDHVQRKLREVKGVSILIHDQGCAAEKRRKRRRKLIEDPPKRLWINPRICEGCGDCQTQSNCLAIVPKPHLLGMKRAVDQSICNKDFSCAEGFCPSFLTLHNVEIKKQSPNATRLGDIQSMALPEAKARAIDRTHPYNILITGIGGTGVVTIGALLGMAAHLEGKGVTVLDMAGLAQKGGPVISHIRIGNHPDTMSSNRVSTGNADLILGCDLMVAASPEITDKSRKGKTLALVNESKISTGEFTLNADWHYPDQALKDRLNDQLGTEHVNFIDANQITTALLGDSLFTNCFMLGFAWQQGALPLDKSSLMAAIQLNNVQVDANLSAFHLGRLAAYAPDQVKQMLSNQNTQEVLSLEEALAFYYQELKAYQPKQGLADQWQSAVDHLKTSLDNHSSQDEEKDQLLRAFAHSYYRVLAIKDEYEVARLATAPEVQQQLSEQFTAKGKIKLNYLFAPPLFNKPDPILGRPKKRDFGNWMIFILLGLAKMRSIRGQWYDPLRQTHEHRLNRRIRQEFEQEIIPWIDRLDSSAYDAFTQRLEAYDQIRGFGPVREANYQRFLSLTASS